MLNLTSPGTKGRFPNVQIPRHLSFVLNRHGVQVVFKNGMSELSRLKLWNIWRHLLILWVAEVLFVHVRPWNPTPVQVLAAT